MSDISSKLKDTISFLVDAVLYMLALRASCVNPSIGLQFGVLEDA